jgi:predicted transcriptional regulator
MPVLSIRLDDQSLRKIRRLAGKENKDQSAVARELIEQGWDYLMLRQYKDGKLSLGRLAEELGRPLGETIDFLTELGVPSPITFEDYLLGFENLKRVEKSNQHPEK